MVEGEGLGGGAGIAGLAVSRRREAAAGPKTEQDRGWAVDENRMQAREQED